MWSRYESIETNGISILLLWKRSTHKVFSTTISFFKLPSYPTSFGISQPYCSTIKIPCQPLSNVVHFLWFTLVGSITYKPKTLLRVLQSVQFILFWFRRSNINQLVVIVSRKRLLFKTWCTSVVNASSPL